MGKVHTERVENVIISVYVKATSFLLNYLINSRDGGGSIDKGEIQEVVKILFAMAGVGGR